MLVDVAVCCCRCLGLAVVEEVGPRRETCLEQLEITTLQVWPTWMGLASERAFGFGAMPSHSTPTLYRTHVTAQGRLSPPIAACPLPGSAPMGRRCRLVKTTNMGKPLLGLASFGVSGGNGYILRGLEWYHRRGAVMECF